MNEPTARQAYELKEAIAEDARRQQKRLAQQQREVSAQVAAELNLLLRDKAHSHSTLRYAEGALAELRDVLLAHEDKRDRWRASHAWLDDADDDSQSARWEAFELVQDARDDEREATRTAQAERRAKAAQERAQDIFAKVDGKPALAIGSDNHHPPPKKNPRTFITTLTTRQPKNGAAIQWTQLCPMTGSWRTDDGARQKRLQRQVSKWLVELESDDFVVEELTEGEYDTLRERWRKRAQRNSDAPEVRGTRYPLPAGRVALIHNMLEDAGDDAQPLPTTEEELRQLLEPILDATPEDKRITPIGQLFGGNYTGNRGEGRRKVAQANGERVAVVGQWVTEGAKGIMGAAAALDIELDKTAKGGRELEHVDAMLALWDAGYTFKARRVHKHNLTALWNEVTQQDQQPEGRSTNNLSRITHNTKTGICTLFGTQDAQPEALLVENEPQEAQPPPKIALKSAREVAR